jgi:hypothetical protein
MKGDIIPPAEGGDLVGNVGMEFVQFAQVGGQVFLVGLFVGRISLDQGLGDPAADVLRQHRVQPDVGIALSWA